MNERARSLSMAISCEPFLTNFRFVPLWMIKRFCQIAGKWAHHAMLAIFTISDHRAKIGAVWARCDEGIAAHFIRTMREKTTFVERTHLPFSIGVAGDCVEFRKKDEALLLILRICASQQVWLRHCLSPLSHSSFARAKHLDELTHIRRQFSIAPHGKGQIINVF